MRKATCRELAKGTISPESEAERLAVDDLNRIVWDAEGDPSLIPSRDEQAQIIWARWLYWTRELDRAIAAQD